MVHLYPNKFKIITREEQAKDPGLYYINDKIPQEAIQPLSRWIRDVLTTKVQVPAGERTASIKYTDFCDKYYPEGKPYIISPQTGQMLKSGVVLTSTMNPTLALQDRWYRQGINPIVLKTSILVGNLK